MDAESFHVVRTRMIARFERPLRWCLGLLAGAAIAGAPAAAAPWSTPGDGSVALKVDHILAAPGQMLGSGWIVIHEGRIQAVGVPLPPEGASTLEFPGATACAGFIDPVTALGSAGELDEPARAILPQAAARDTLHPFHPEFREAAQGGLTTVGLSPGSSNLVGGRVAVVHTSGDSGCAFSAAEGPLRLALTEAALLADRNPTSRMGAADALRQFVAQGVPGSGPLLVDAQSEDEIRLCLELLPPAGRDLVFLDPAALADAIDLLKISHSWVVLGPFSTATATRTLRVAAVLEAEEVPFAFTAGGNPSALRLTAALAVREGLSPEAALAALTIVPARILGIEQQAGTLEAGKRADLIVWNGDPLDLGSAVQAVLVGGAGVDREDAR